MEDRATPHFALVPLRNGKRLLHRCPHERRRLKRFQKQSELCGCCLSSSSSSGSSPLPPPRLPCICFVSPENSIHASITIIGRMEFLHALWEACLLYHNGIPSCDETTECSCSECQNITAWASRHLSRRLFQCQATNFHVLLWINRNSKYCQTSLDCLQIISNGKDIVKERNVFHFANEGEKENHWWGPIQMSPGDTIQIRKNQYEVIPMMEFRLCIIQSCNNDQVSTPVRMKSLISDYCRASILLDDIVEDDMKDIDWESQLIESQNDFQYFDFARSNQPSLQEHPLSNIEDSNSTRAVDVSSAALVPEYKHCMDIDPIERLPFGTFASGMSIYRNRLNSGERFENGHVGIANLVTPHCEAVFGTSFSPAVPEWLDTFLEDVKDLIVVQHDFRRNDSGCCLVGEANLIPMVFQNGEKVIQHERWFWIPAKPITGGFLHSKLLLFRSMQGLRVVICGSNLSQRQWEFDRDTLWVQDFFVNTSKPPPFSLFAHNLRLFCSDLCSCQDPKENRHTQSVLHEMFQDVHFHTSARLVFSFPRGKESQKIRGGWEQLALSVENLQQGICSDSMDDEEGGIMSPAADMQQRRSIVYSMAGSVGDLRPDFMLQMYQAMNGITSTIPEDTPWEDVNGQIRSLWPSRSTAKTMVMTSARAMPLHHWNTIPALAKQQNFFDSIPNPPELSLPEFSCYAFSHSKVLIKTGGNIGVIYVGSHNFSQAAWGLREKGARNIELGVVLATSSTSLCSEWKSRLPAFLPAEEAISPETYVPASPSEDCRAQWLNDESLSEDQAMDTSLETIREANRLHCEKDNMLTSLIDS